MWGFLIFFKVLFLFEGLLGCRGFFKMYLFYVMVVVVVVVVCVCVCVCVCMCVCVCVCVFMSRSVKNTLSRNYLSGKPLIDTQ